MVWLNIIKLRETRKCITLSALFLHYSLPPDTKIPRPKISFREKKTYIENKYELYSRTCSYGSSMIEGVDFTVSYEPVSGIRYLQIIIAIASAECLVIFVLDISNDFQNKILTNTKERVYLSLPHLYLEWSKRKFTKHTWN